MQLLKIDVPKHLQAMVGSDHNMVAPVHTVSPSMKPTRHNGNDGLVYVYEPRRDCYYWVYNSSLYHNQKNWRF